MWNSQRNLFLRPKLLDSTVWSSTINYHWSYGLITYKRIQEVRIKDNDSFTFIFFFLFFYERSPSIRETLIIENRTNYICLLVSLFDHLYALLFIKCNIIFTWHNKLEKFRFSLVNCKIRLLLVKTRLLYW